MKPTEEQVKKACEISFVLMYLLADDEYWYEISVDASLRYSENSFRSVFWWAIRMLPEQGFGDFWEYLKWKWYRKHKPRSW